MEKLNQRSVCVLYMVFFAFLGCNSNKVEEIKSVENRNNKEDFIQMEWVEYNKVIGLLAIKYGIDTVNIKPLLLEYLMYHNPDLYFDLTLDDIDGEVNIFDYLFKPPENAYMTIKRLSNQYSVEASTLSSFIFDFELYSKIIKVENDISWLN